MAEEKVIADRPAQQDQSEASDPTDGLLYAPSDPGKAHHRRRRPSRPRPVVSYRKPESSSPAAEAESNVEQEAERITLEEAFKLDIGDDPRNDELAVRAASFLLDWASGEGNEEVEGILALGISRVLDLAASNMARTRQRNRKQAED